MAHSVFVSYSSKDKPVADAVVASLENSGMRCWYAPRDITPGASWGDAIVTAIESARIMVIILSGNSNQSRQVLREVERAVAHGAVIIPFRIENIIPTGAMAYFLSTEHWLDALTPPLEEHIHKLGETIQVFLTGEAPAPGVRSPTMPAALPRDSTRSWQTLRLPVLLSLAVLIILSVIFLPRLAGKFPTGSTSTPTHTSPPPTDTATLTPPPPSPTPAPPELTLLGQYRTSRAANGLFLDGSMLYLANGEDGLVRLNVSNPAEPRPIDTFLAGEAQDVSVAGDYAYVASGQYERNLQIVPLSSDGVAADHKFPGSSLYHIALDSDLAHLTGHNQWTILDVSDPTKPRQVWSWSPPGNSGNPCNAALDGAIAFIACGWEGLFVFDISDPQNPLELGGYDTPDWIIGIALEGDTLYLSLGDSGLLSLDVSDPARPIFLDRINLDGFTGEISAAGECIYIVYNVIVEYITQESGIVVVDISDPANLSVITVYNDFQSATAVEATENAVFVADKMQGVFVLRLDSTP